MEKITRVDRILKYEGAIVDCYTDLVKLPNGHVAGWDYIAHRKGAAAVLPVLENGKILMVRQYRNALDRETLEIPAGARDDVSEPTIVCAARELEEETGYRCDHLEFLMRIATTVAFCNEQIDVYLAADLVKTKQHLDEDEFLNVEEWDLDDLVQMIFAGKLSDSKTVGAILAYREMLRNQ